MQLQRIAAKKPLKPINPRILKFVQAYIEHGNASEAMRQAGYTNNRPDQYGYRLLQTNRVKQAIERLTLDKFSKGYVVRKYSDIIETSTQPHANFQNHNVAVKALENISAIQGHNAPTKTESVQISGTLDDIRTILGQYAQDE
jgi:phage terminase small subunit